MRFDDAGSFTLRKQSFDEVKPVGMQHDRDFGVRSDKQLGNFLKETGVKSLNDLIHSDRGKKK